ncbi:MAG TPA: hypothetical protein VFV01_16845 [Spirillospora sp.]|nr:hypothetical protein [Spirillospora sp.]
MTVTPTDLGTYLGVTIDPGDDRAMLLIDLATQLCESIVNPLPDGADAVVLDVVSRAFTNPTNAHQQTTGPFSASYGTVAGGLWLTRANKATLRRLAGSGGAFTIDVAPVTAPAVPWWEVNTWGFDDLADWNQTP